ncbi:RBBP9/YdeN family alpha/beta hydrolase [Chitinophaga rhizophila]|uniref:Alpha/beta fold hydrolase n=1 Tax=Chitinophaga rhizophila TaxID=2866212 RepID=A0ABS7GGN7_9BACT|nr:alpha/beta fold hydrolase [Chitinophaga rhizophila]MBW8686859.1 alpha/beta fold hydrolase [Chitinophaga rhizophila]
MEVNVLTAPGLYGSGPLHWQTIWEHTAGIKRIHQQDWDRPEMTEWVKTIEAAVAKAGPDVVIAAHSLGCIALAHWAQQTRLRIKGALMVAPADAERPGFPVAARGFAPIPMSALPFKSIVVSSTNDQYASLERARSFADAWGSRFVNAGEKGHINADSDLGEWPAGQVLLTELVRDWHTL